ncbi:cation diffusion facilitator family transporter [Stratiformator vulcanicus]|uniref:Putative cation efflux system protein n=1 Tax=Stratiformator vulcanicus TaxID=2527980 RepID=A0A517R1V8_9PLAN|nr:cation diffusion facilitator family transporter [Stratiformator vulcanicus]QDT37858.1 putative cation efflux system protein [Stratiformator vulcanicus]
MLAARSNSHHPQDAPTSSEASVEFPEPVAPPEEVSEARTGRTNRLLWIAGAGISVRLLVIAAELTAVVLLGSAALFVDAMATLADVIASIGLIVAIKLAERPPDDDHPFGHGRYEPLAGLQLGTLITLGGGALFISQLISAAQPHQAKTYSIVLAIIPAAAAVLLEIACRWVHSYGRRESSSALIAEAYHYRVDAITSVLAAVGMLVAVLLPNLGHLTDHVFALLLAGIMTWLGIGACRENMHQLLDRTPDESAFERVRTAAARIDGVLDIEKIRIQQAGPDAHVDIDVEVDPQMTVDDAHRIAQFVRREIQSDWPFVREVVVHIEPYFADDH